MNSLKLLLPGQLILALMFALSSSTATAQAISQSTDEAIHNIILSQIEAFANDDIEAAWGYASKGIQLRSGSMSTFYNMVRTTYPPVHRASAIEFMKRTPHTGFQIQEVRLRGPEGKRWRAYYRMEWNGDAWRIGGVALKQAPGTI